MENLIQNKKYFIDQLNSSKAFQFISMYHYSHMGFKKATLNLGIFLKNTQKLVGVLQWGCSAQDKINLSRYVKEPITNKQYLELNRFAMADSEGKNSESQAISLGIKWIKKFKPEIQLLVSYSGRIEGNYGYIYQATNWEYLGYFISSAFWQVDGKELHQITLAYHYKKNKKENESLVDYLCRQYHDVRHYDSKQFIYIIRLNKKLTPVSKQKNYPKPSTDAPIQTRWKIYQENQEYLTQNNSIQIKDFYYKPNEKLFTNKCLARNGQLIKNIYIIYNKNGELLEVLNSISEIVNKYNCSDTKVRYAIKNATFCNDILIRKQKENEQIFDKIKSKVLCWIDNQPFYKQKEVAEYVGVSRQAVSGCYLRRGKIIGGKKVIWED